MTENTPKPAYTIVCEKFTGSNVVLETTDPKEAAKYLREHGSYKGGYMVDGGHRLHISGENPRWLFQGSGALDTWIERHTA